MKSADRPRVPTMADVAERAGVSRALVSIVFRGVAGASPATRERVMQAAEELDFVPEATQRLAGSDPSTHDLDGDGPVGMVLRTLPNQPHTSPAHQSTDRESIQLPAGEVLIARLDSGRDELHGHWMLQRTRPIVAEEGQYFPTKYLIASAKVPQDPISSSFRSRTHGEENLLDAEDARAAHR